MLSQGEFTGACFCDRIIAKVVAWLFSSANKGVLKKEKSIKCELILISFEIFYEVNILFLTSFVLFQMFICCFSNTKARGTPAGKGTFGCLFFTVLHLWDCV